MCDASGSCSRRISSDGRIHFAHGVVECREGILQAVWANLFICTYSGSDGQASSAGPPKRPTATDSLERGKRTRHACTDRPTASSETAPVRDIFSQPHRRRERALIAGDELRGELTGSAGTREPRCSRRKKIPSLPRLEQC